MPVDTKQIMDAAEKIGQLLMQHPAVEKYKQAQKAVTDDPDASRLLADFDRQIQKLGQQEQAGAPVTDAQRQQLESLQSKIISHIRIKSLNMAQVDFVDLLRKINQTIQRPLLEAQQGTAARAGDPGAGPRLTIPHG